MNDIIRNIEKDQIRTDIADFNTGDTVRVYAKIKEGTRERIGVEKTWPVNSPNLDRVEVIRHGKVRRARLFYLRERVGKKAKVKEKIS